MPYGIKVTNNKLQSSAIERKCVRVQYKVGEFVSPVIEGSALCVYRDIYHATADISKASKMVKFWLAEYEDYGVAVNGDLRLIVGYDYLEDEELVDIFKEFWSTKLIGKHNLIDTFVRFPWGTMLAKRVKLIRQLTPLELNLLSYKDIPEISSLTRDDDSDYNQQAA